jgi:hypothetical protein
VVVVSSRIFKVCGNKKATLVRPTANIDEMIKDLDDTWSTATEMKSIRSWRTPED